MTKKAHERQLCGHVGGSETHGWLTGRKGRHGSGVVLCGSVVVVVVVVLREVVGSSSSGYKSSDRSGMPLKGSPVLVVT